MAKKNWSASLLKSRDLVGSRLLSPHFVGIEVDGDFFPFHMALHSPQHAPKQRHSRTHGMSVGTLGRAQGKTYLITTCDKLSQV